MASLQRLDTARQLCRALEAGDEASAESLISELNEAKSRAMLRQLADLTREVHHSFSGVAFDPKLIEMTKQAMPDARERLSYVIVKMEESAHRTLGAVEEMLGVTEKMTENTNELETILTSGAALETARLIEFVNAGKAHGERVHRGLTEVLMAQEYQDLTGQVIKRTIEIVGELERGLVSLITQEWVAKPAAPSVPVDSIAGTGPAFRPQANVVSLQTDVDDLLASLGV